MDRDKAAEWFRKASEHGNSNGQWRLGTMYRFGEGVEIDLEKADEWYRKSRKSVK